MNSKSKIEFTKRDIYIIGILFALVFILIIRLIENYIIRHILLIFSLAYLGILVCLYFSLLTDKKEIKIFILATLVCGLCLPYLFSWIHELNHAFTTLFIDEINLLGIEVYYPYGGATHVRAPRLIFKEDFLKFCWLHFSGSVGSIITVLSLNRIIYHTKRINFFWFLSLFITTSWWILYELSYWIDGIDYYLAGNEVINDAYQFLDIYLFIDDPIIPITPLILKILLILFATFFFIWCVFNIRRRIKNTRKSEKENKIMLD